MGDEARLGARLDLDGGPFTKTLKESRSEVRSFEKDMKFLSQGMGLAFGVTMLEKFGGALKDLRKFQEENHIEIVSTDTLDKLDGVGTKLEEAKMRVTAFGAVIAGFVMDQVQALSAGIASGFDVEIMADATREIHATADSMKELAAATKDAADAAERLAESHMTPTQLVEQREKDLEDAKSKAQNLHEAKDLGGERTMSPTEIAVQDAAIKRADAAVAKAQMALDKAKGGKDQADKKFEADREHKEDERERFNKGLDESMAKARADGEKVRAERQKKADEEKKKKEHEAIEVAVTKQERQYQLEDVGKGIGFQHQQGGAYAGLVGNQQNKNLSIAERSAKASEKLVQLAEHWARRDAVDKIKHGDGL